MLMNIAKGNIEYYQCTDCKKYFSDSKGTKEILLAATITAMIPHSYITTVEPATPDEEGTVVEECSVCGDVENMKSFAYPDEVKLSKK